jgi:hypothetical protein
MLPAAPPRREQGLQTIETYLDALDLFIAYLTAPGMPRDVHAIRRDSRISSARRELGVTPARGGITRV